MKEQEVLQEAAGILLKNLEPAKVARFWAAWQMGVGDYLAIREELFAGETVMSLYEKVLAYQKGVAREGQGAGEPGSGGAGVIPDS